MRVLITGGAGFIGSNLARRLLADGDDVAIIDDLSTGYAANIDDLDVDFTEASILNEQALASAAQGADAIVHLGALGQCASFCRRPNRLTCRERYRDADGFRSRSEDRCLRDCRVIEQCLWVGP